MTDHTKVMQQALEWAEKHGEAVFSGGGMQAVEAMNAWAKALRAALAAQPEPGWNGEPWEQLAWQLCAEENGEESCNELIWEGGPMPEPWGDRWMKYEGEAKRMIEMVNRYAAPTPPQQKGGV